MTNNNNGVNGSAGGEPAAYDMDSLEEMLRKVRETSSFNYNLTLKKFSLSPWSITNMTMLHSYFFYNMFEFALGTISVLETNPNLR